MNLPSRSKSVGAALWSLAIGAVLTLALVALAVPGAGSERFDAVPAATAAAAEVRPPALDAGVDWQRVETTSIQDGASIAAYER